MGKITNGLIIGTIAGILVALAGARKDSPYEGFKIKTFFRSPIVGAIAGVIVAYSVKSDKKGLFLGSIAVERMIVEGYKLLRAQKAGKFDYGEWGISKKQLA
jgi:hypothetical protein